jgi:hypothetical protein
MWCHGIIRGRVEVHGTAPQEELSAPAVLPKSSQASAQTFGERLWHYQQWCQPDLRGHQYW